MTYSKSVTIWCDAEGCTEWTEPGKWTAYAVRAHAEENGWVTALPGGRDLCPDHAHLAEEFR